METYTNFKGENVNIKGLDDIKLISIYRFLLGYCKTLQKVAKDNNIKGWWYSILFNVKDNIRYLKYIKDMNYLKDRLQKEIKNRKLKMGKIIAP